MSNLSVLAASSFTEVIQKLTAIPAITHAFLRSRATRLLASGTVLVLLYNLILGRRKSRRKYVTNLTAVGESGNAKGLAEYDIIIVGGGMLSFFGGEAKSQNDNTWVRNGWLCACFPSVREPEYSRASA
jgi:hypothetical protein